MFDIITIGSATVDVFIKAKAEIQKVHKHLDACYPIGSKILIDDLHISTGGGGTNTAVAFARMGFKTAWLGKLGTDNNSDLVKHDLTKEKVTILSKQTRGETGYSIILTKLKKDRTILTRKGTSDKLSKSDLPKKLYKTKWIYASSMLGQSFHTLTKIIIKAKKKNIPYAFNPSLYLAKMGTKKLHPIINNCNILILNKEEAQAMLKTRKNTKELLKQLNKHAKIAVITDGPKGASATDGKNIYTIKPPRVKIVETTGAGDAFASAFVAGIIRTKDIPTAMKYGTIQSANVIQHIGAKEKLLDWRALQKAVGGRPREEGRQNAAVGRRQITVGRRQMIVKTEIL